MRRPSILGSLRTATFLLAAVAIGCTLSDGDENAAAPADAAGASDVEADGASAQPAGTVSATATPNMIAQADKADADEAAAARDVAPAAEPEPEPEPEMIAPGSPAPKPSLRAARPPGPSKTKRSGKGGAAIGALERRPAPAMLAPPTDDAPNTEGYDHIAENDFIAVADDARSTFSVDVDTASYSNIRRMIEDGHLPPADAVRIEEMINYFSYDYEAPIGQPFSVNSEASACPWNEDHMLVQVGLQGQVIDQSETPARNLVFLLDVSGSMNNPDKLPLLQRGLGLLVDNMRPEDRVSIVVYAGASGVVLPPTAGTDKTKILDALDNLSAGGSTNGGAGIELAYELAERTFVEDGINRVILATDGDFNVGVSSRGELVRLIEDKRKSGVFLSVLGFGSGNVKDSTMEQLADKGNGNYAYIDSIIEAKKVLVEEAGATLVTIAKDVKIQVEFNPKEVASYRLVGYENRKLAHSDFNDDAKDAGEIGAGHSVTAIYEIVPAAGAKPIKSTDELAYQESPELTKAADSGELMTVKVRYKKPSGSKSTLLTHAVTADDRGWRDTSKDYRFAAAVAEFGLLLRDSKHKGNANYDQALELAKGALGKDPHGHRRGFLRLVGQAKSLSGAGNGSLAIAK